jgi:hypothetical protein
VAEPLIVPMDLERETQRSIRIIDTRSGNRVVTAIEILSLSNKLAETGRDNYRKKQRDMLDARVSLVQIDLLREGNYVLAVPAYCIPETYRAPYRICVVRAAKPDQAEVYRVSLRESLPTIRIPLRESDPDVHLNLQALIAQAYANGGYEEIDYSRDPVPPLRGADASWADALLREKGLR